MANNSNDSNNSSDFRIDNKSKKNSDDQKSLPSFDHDRHVSKKNLQKNNQSKQDNKQKSQGSNVKKEALKQGIKKSAASLGVPEIVTDKILDTETGKELLDSASNASSPQEAAVTVSSLFLKKKILPYALMAIAPFLLIILMVVMIFSKNSFSGVSANYEDEDMYQELIEEIKDVVSQNSYKGNIDGTLILATLIGYNDNEVFEEDGSSTVDIDYLIDQVPLLVDFQIMTNTSCDYDSSTLRKIASNDDWLSGDMNYNCVPDMEGETYSISLEQGDYDDDNSGSVYYWNLIDEDFIFDFYNEYMVNKDDNTYENVDKINEIIDEIYAYYYSILEDEDTNAYFYPFNNSSSDFWWPVGSSETTTIGGKLFAKGEPTLKNISSNFGWRTIEGVSKIHGAIDISGEGRINVDNVIASKKGVVVYPYEDWQTQFADHPGSAYGNNDGGGYGNYVKIDHGNGEYTLYAHMAQNSIIVRAGDIVEQGQVIGKVGHTGSSTGAHLHFEIYIGGSTHDYRVDPLLYVNPDNPRPNTKGIKEWIKTIEDGTSHHMNGDNYIVYKANDGSLKVGYGITLVDKDGNRLYKDIYNGPINEGAIIANEIVDEMFETMIAHSKALLNSYITANNTTLLTHQYDAILSVMLDEGDNVGNILLQTYGNNQNTTALWQKMSQYITRDDGGKLAEIYSLKLRRAEEFELFMEGDYEYDPLGYTSSSPVKYYDVDNW